MLATPELIRQSNQQRLLEAALPRWLREVPLYRRHAADGSHPGEEEGPEAILERLPLITKEDIRRNFPANFLRRGQELEALLEQDLVELEHTSGSTDERTPLLLGRGWWSEQEARALRLNGFVERVLEESPEARRVNLSSPNCNGDICYHGVPSRHDRIVGDALVASLSRQPFLWSERELERIVGETLDWQPQFLDVDPVYGVVFARYCERQGVRLPGLKFVLCSYEYLSVAHRQILERAFRVPVFNLYGSTETGHLLMEDERGRMLPSLETAHLEIINADMAGIGELVVTTVTNDYMPLLRYWIGDLVELRAEPYQTAYVLHGRLADAVRAGDGGCRTLRQVDECFRGISGIAHYQLRREQKGGFTLWYVPDGPGPDARGLAELRTRLSDLLQCRGSVTFRPSDILLAEPSGKFRLTL